MNCSRFEIKNQSSFFLDSSVVDKIWLNTDIMNVCNVFRSKEKGFMETCASVTTSLVLKIKANCAEVRFLYSRYTGNRSKLALQKCFAVLDML